MLPRGLRRGQVNFRSHNSCVSLRESPCGRRRACVLFEDFFWGGYSATGVPGDTVWLALPPTGWGGRSVLSYWVEQQERKATQHISGSWRCANPPRGEPSLPFYPSCLALRAAPGNDMFG